MKNPVIGKLGYLELRTYSATQSFKDLRNDKGTMAIMVRALYTLKPK